MPDEKWLQDLFIAHHKRLLAIGRLFVGGDPLHAQAAEDMVQETFLLLWDKREKLSAHPNIGGWLIVTMRAMMLNYLKKQKRHGKHLAFSLNEEGAEPRVSSTFFELPDDALAQKENLNTLKTLLGEENATLFYNYCVLNKSAGELAKALGLSEGCVRMRVLRLKKTILENKELFLSVLMVLSAAGSVFTA